MYLYTFILDDGRKDHVIGDIFQKALSNYFQWRGMEILTGKKLNEILIYNYPTHTGEPYKVQTKILHDIFDTFKKQNAKPARPLLTIRQPPTPTRMGPPFAPKSPDYPPPEFVPTSPDYPPPPLTMQEERCKEMQDTCPEGSRDAEPLLQEDWCDDVPFKEFVKNDKYLTQCYRLTHLLKTFQGQLETTKGDNPFPQWPNDPISRNALSPERLTAIYKQAEEAGVDIPEIFKKFMQAMNFGEFDIDIAMAGPYIGTTDQINPKYMTKFVEPAVEALYKKSMTQEERDLEMALKLVEQI